MIVAVTLNPAVDKTLIVRAFEPGTTNRATVDRVDVGGKGINVARTLRQLGCDVVATGFLDAGDRHGTGVMLAHEGINADFVPVDGELRVNLKIIDSAAGLETEINEPGFVVPRAAIDALADKLRVLAAKASMMVFSGSLPPGAPIDLYAQLVALARGAGVPSMLDTADEALTHGLAAGPDLVKPNRAEAEQLLSTRIADDRSLVTAGHSILGRGARRVVISLGPAGAFSASSDGMWRARLPAVSARSTVGAGDAMMAALAYGHVRSLHPVEALRLATAAACAAAAAAERYPSSVAIQQLLPRVHIEPLTAASVDTSPGMR